MNSKDTAAIFRVADDADLESNAFVEALVTDNIDLIRSATRHFLHSTNSPARAARFIRGAVRKTPPSDFKPFRVALLSSFSIEMVHDPLIAHGCTEGLAVDIYQPGYDQYHQEILASNSGLYKANPDAIILASMACISPNFPSKPSERARRATKLSWSGTRWKR